MSEASRDRTRLAGLVLCGVFVVMAGRGGYLALSGKPAGDAVITADQAAPRLARADILDRNGELIATSVETYSLWANPSMIWDAEEVAIGLNQMFPEIGLETLKSKLSDPKRKFEWVKRGLTPRQREAVMALKFEGLNFRSEMRRAYPLGELAGAVLGQVDLDG
jgi:cell division protein FtsI (penicillin-binding protein 3)